MANIKFSEFSETQEVADIPFLVGYGADNKRIPTEVLLSASKGLIGTQYVFVQAKGSAIENAIELQAAYTLATTMSPSALNRVTVIAAPGNYNFSTGPFEMNTEYIDLVSLDGNRSIVFDGGDTIHITANDVFVKGVDVLTNSFFIGSDLPKLTVENCKGGTASFGASVQVSGTFINCTGGDSSFGVGVQASGTFTNCTAGAESFGAGARASGIFTNCVAGDASFAGGGTASGTFTNCKGGVSSFGNSGEASGTFTNCTGGIYSFAGGGTASGTFIGCIGGDESFGGNGTASGTFTNCTGGDSSFAGGGGDLGGKLYYCRLTAGGFGNVVGAGRTVLCIDGDNNQNNQ